MFDLSFPHSFFPVTIIGRYWQVLAVIGSYWQLLAVTGIHDSTINFFISEEDSCFKGCISRNAVKSSVISEATQQVISGLPPGVTLDGVFYNTIPSTHIKVFFESSLHQR
jgi:hypothetical protein